MKSFSPIDTLTAQIARFCANDGSWGGVKVRFTEWNLELINSMVNTMSSRWDTYTKMSTALIGDLEIKILGSVDRLISQIEGIPPEDLGKNPLFGESIRNNANILLPDFQGAPVFAESLVTKKDSIKCVFVMAKELARTQIE